MTRYILGPELFWLLLYIAAGFIGKANTPPSKAMDDFIETLWFWIPAVSILVFSLWWIPTVEKKLAITSRLDCWIIGWTFCSRKSPERL